MIFSLKYTLILSSSFAGYPMCLCPDVRFIGEIHKMDYTLYCSKSWYKDEHNFLYSSFFPIRPCQLAL